MAIGLAPKLPLSRSEIDGFYGLTKNIVETVISEAAGRIQEQVDTYMPYIEILDIVVAPREEDITISNEHTLFLGIEYIILPISLTDRVAIEVG